MSEDTTTSTDTTSTEADASGTATETDATDWKTEAEKWRSYARKNEERAKANATAAKELEQFRKAQMTETEKAVAEAKQAGRIEALTETGKRLARAELRATAAGRVEKDALDGFLEFADLSKFIGEDGEPNGKAIEAAVAKLAGPTRAPSFDGGARTTASKATDMNRLIRQKAGLG